MANTENTASYGVELEDGISQPADSASTKLRQLKSDIDGGNSALGQMKRAMAQLEAATEPNKEAIADLGGQMRRAKQDIADANAEYIKLGGSFAKGAGGKRGGGKPPMPSGYYDHDPAKVFGPALPPKPLGPELPPPEPITPPVSEIDKFNKAVGLLPAPIQRAVGMVQKLNKASESLPAPLASIVGKLTNLNGMTAGAALKFGLLAGAIILVVVAAAKLASALVTATIDMTKFAIASQNARRSELLRLEGLSRTRTAMSMTYGLGKNKAEDMQKAIDEVAAKTAISRDRVAQYAEQLHMAGARGANFNKALEGTAIVASAAGEAHAGMFAQWAAGTSLMGGSVDRLTKRVKDRYGGIVQKQMKDLNVVAMKNKESMDTLFTGAKIERFLDMWQQLNDLIAASTNAGRGLRLALGPVFQPFIDGGTFALKALKRFFQGIIIGVLVVSIVFMKLRNLWRSVFPPDQSKQIGKGFDAFVYIGLAAFAVLSVAVIALTVLMGVLAIATLAVATPFIIALVIVGALIYAVIKLGMFVAKWFKDTDFATMGANVFLGFIDGVKSVWTAVTGVFSDLGKALIKAFKQALDMHSPSKVFEALGENIPAGLTLGIEAGTPGAVDAVTDMASRLAPGVALPPAVGTPGVESGAARGGGSIQIASLVVNAGPVKDGGVADARMLAQAIKRELESILQGVAVQMGAGAV
jgi:hypothetical protein